MIRRLYGKDSKGSIRLWEIEATDDGVLITHGIVGGNMQEKVEKIEGGKGGRNLHEQIMSRFKSRINKQLDKGYVDNLEDAKNNTRVSASGFLRPMLASPIKNVSNINFKDAYYQHKYDGNRCLVTKKGGVNIAYTRNGKIINSIGHIIDNIKLMEGETIDGELYCHGISLQIICSWVKKEQQNTLKLSYRVYDIILNTSYTGRLETLKDLELGESAEIVETTKITSIEDAYTLFKSSRKDGYEGGIVRWGDMFYEDGKRSKSLIKIKSLGGDGFPYDEEFTVIDVIPSKDGWARFLLRISPFKEFYVSSPGSMEEKYKIMKNKELYIGREVTVGFFSVTKDGIPFHPIAIRMKEEI